MPEAQLVDLKMHYDVYGAGEPLLLIMGLTASSASWNPRFIEELSESLRVITFDNRGTGESENTPEGFSIAKLADDAVGLLDNLKLPKAHIFGVSMGGMVAQELALRHPARVATLTLGCTMADGPNAVMPTPETLATISATTGGTPAEAVRLWWPLNYTADFVSSHRDELEAALPRLIRYPTPPDVFRRQFEAVFALKTWDRLPQIQVPTLVVAGAEDALIPPKNSELLAARIPGAILHLIPNAGHQFTHQAREEFLSFFVPFLKSHQIE